MLRARQCNDLYSMTCFDNESWGKTHGRETMFLQETHMWNYSPLPRWSRAEILDGHWELPCGITASHSSLNICTDGKTQGKVFSLSRGLFRQSCWIYCKRPCCLQLAILWKWYCKVYWSRKAFKHCIDLLDFIYIVKVQQVLKGFAVLELAAP